jgi:hydrogenase maturation protease
MTGTDFWRRMESRGPDVVEVDGVRLEAGSRVRLRPNNGGDIFDLALGGRVAVVEAIEQDDEGKIKLAVTVEDDPGRDLGDARMPGHRFFYAIDEVEPLASSTGAPVLVAGIGNIFLGDDGFGVEVVRRLAGGPVTPGVDVVDFGIRGMDLAYALQRNYRAAILVDASARGCQPGTLTVLQPQLPEWEPVTLQTHGMDPVRVLALARHLGRIPQRTYVVCCEPESIPAGGPDEEVVVALSAPVRAAIDAAVDVVRGLVNDVLSGSDRTGGDGHEEKEGHETDGRHEEQMVGGGTTAGRRDGRDSAQAMAGDPAVHEDATDVAG